MSKREKRKANFWIAILPVLFVVTLLMVAVLDIEKYVGLANITCDAHMPLFFGAMFAALVSIFILGYSWSELEDRIIETIKMSMGAILILLVIGMLIGTWVISGIVPAMVYYGLDILNPTFFLVATVLICSVVSLATGSSWGTAGTVGVALMGISSGLGIDPAIAGGAVISGAYFGDKMSPLSDTTNLAPAMSGATLFDHIHHMVFTTAPAYIITLVLFALLGMEYGSGSIDPAQIAAIQDGLNGVFANMTPFLLLGPILVIVLVVFKVPAIPSLFIGAVVGAILAITLQGASGNDVVNAFQYGFVSETGNAAIDTLLTRGGMSDMLWTINLIIVAMCFGGVMEKSGMLAALAETALKGARGVGGLVIATVFSSIFMNFITGDQYLSIVIPGRMYKRAYDDAGLAPRNLSRALEDGGTVSSPLIPWNTCGAMMIATLGLTPWTYVPYCFFNILSPIVSIVYGITGFTMMKRENDPTWKKAQAALGKAQPKTASVIAETELKAPVTADVSSVKSPSVTTPAVQEKPVTPPKSIEPAIEALSVIEPVVVVEPVVIIESEQTPIPEPVVYPQFTPHVAPKVKETSLSLIVSGKTVDLGGVPIILTNDGITMLPLAKLGEALGYTVNVNSYSNSAVLIKGEERVTVAKDHLDYTWGTTQRTFKENPDMFNNNLYVPIDFITSNPGLKLNQTTTSVTVDVQEPVVMQVITGEIKKVTLFSNGVGLTIEDSTNTDLLLYVTEKTKITNDSTGALVDREELKIGVYATFSFTKIAGAGQSVFNVLGSVKVLENVPVPVLVIPGF